MKNHKYKLATLVLSTGLLLGACGGDDEAQAPEDQSDDTTVEETEDTTTTEEDTEGTEESPDDTSEEETSGDTADSEGSVEDDSSDGTGGSDDGEQDTTGETTDETTDESSESADSTGVAVLDELGSTPEDAVSAAQENFDGELTELELDDDNGQWVYKVHLENDSEEYEVDLSADDLSVLNEETESEDNNDTEDQFSYGDAIPHDEAVQTAMDEVGGELESWTLDKDDGQLEYDVELRNTDNGNDTDVTINAESGEVIEVDN
ncbi:PepSY domain-containing protein [Salinicoccus sp. Marseille-QA3877]